MHFFESEIENNPDITVIDATEGGAYIKGSVIMPMRDVISQYCTKTYPINEWIESLPKLGDEVKSEMDGIMCKHYHRVLETRKVLVNAVKLNEELKVRWLNGTFTNQETRSLCDQYDRVYKSIVNQELDPLTLYYANDLLQDYIKKALSLENDQDLDKKLDLEKDMFMGLADRNRELEVYIKQIYPNVEMGD